MRMMDFSSWEALLTSLLGLAMFMLLGVGIRIVMMMTIQARQQRQNRQINERLRTLIAAYKVLGGSFTGNLLVDPTHLRDLKASAEAAGLPFDASEPLAERNRRIRDAVEAALSDIILLGTAEQVKLAATAAQAMVEGKAIETADLVLSLRSFIREALDLEEIPTNVTIPSQGPTRPAATGPGGGRGRGEAGRDGGRGGEGGEAAGGAAGGGGMMMAPMMRRGGDEL